jgi:hypothetical protein
VGSKGKDALSSMAGANGGSTVNAPGPHIPELGQAEDNSPEPGLDPRGVLKDHPSRAQSSHGVQDVWPKEPFICFSFTRARTGSGLARWASTDYLDYREHIFPSYLGDISQVRYSGPVFS